MNLTKDEATVAYEQGMENLFIEFKGMTRDCVESDFSALVLMSADLCKVIDAHMAKLLEMDEEAELNEVRVTEPE
jgi:hypothetical protein